MKRREFIALIGSAAVATPRAVRAQQTMPVIGFLSVRSPDDSAEVRAAFHRGLNETGYVEGRNVVIEYRWAEGQNDRLPALAADLVRRPVAVLVAPARPTAVVAKAATATIQIVFTSGDDPVRIGLVASLNNPGGNATGVSVFTTALGPKRLGLLREFLPKPGLVAFVVHPDNESTPFQIEEMQAAAKALGQPLLVLNAGTEAEVDAVFATMAQQNVSAVLYGATLFFQVIADRLIALAARYRIPASYEWRDAVEAGGLMSYNTNRAEIGRQLGSYVARILRGAKPSELPVVQSSNFVFIINLKTAKALGIEVPPNLLARADEVIE